VEKMTTTYRQIEQYFDNKIITHIDPDSVWVEIGSERGEGSTINLLAQAKKFNVTFHTVDIDDSCARNLDDPLLTCHVDIGSTWTKQYATRVGKKISLLHLDNFDWIWNPYSVPDFIQTQIAVYQNQFGLVMNNQRCQQEHFEQAMNLLPWFSDNCLVAMDDTFLQVGAWTGKCGPAVTYLKLNGLRVVYTDAGGVIMAKGYNQIPELSTDAILHCKN
jgi:hypothetical protein